MAEYFVYFPFFKPQDWRKRSVIRGRGFIQRFPGVYSSTPSTHSDSGPFFAAGHIGSQKNTPWAFNLRRGAQAGRAPENRH